MPIFGTDSAETLNGTAGDDSIYGAAGDDTILAGDGNDFVSGGEGGDSIDGGPGSDSILGGAGGDLIRAGDGDDWVNYVGETGHDTVYGGSGNDFVSLPGSTGTKTLLGESGDDTLNGGIDNDTIDGGPGSDSINGGEGADSLLGGLDNDVIAGAAGDDTIDGGDGDDFIIGGEGNDSIVGGAGVDSILGGAGNDLIHAGDGDDWLSYADESGDDTVYGGGGHDLLNFSGGSDRKRLFGEAGNDTLSGGLAGDTLDGGEGDDSLSGGEGADSILGGPGADSISGGAGNDFINAGDGDDQLGYVGDDGHDTVQAGAGNDLVNYFGSIGNKYLSGESGDDTLSGGFDDDTLDGGVGGDSLSGGEGDDTYIIDSRFDRIHDSDGVDTAIVSADWVKVPSTIEQVSYVNGARPLPYWISALLYDDASGSQFKRLLGGVNDVNFAFPSTIPAYDSDADHADGYTAFDLTQKANARVALAYIETIIDLNFIEVEDPARLNTIAFALNRQSNSGGYSLAPADKFSASDVFLNDVDYNATLNPGSYGAQVLIHEIGHAIGLKHPFDEADAEGGTAEPPYLEGEEDSTLWTQMSYNDAADQYVLSFSPLDVAALQYLYGPSPLSRATDDTYVLNAEAANFVWDGAGIDRLDASGAAQGVTLSLEAGTWSHFGAAPASTITAPGQITINFGTVIEQALGSAFADRIDGNEVNNSLYGGDGSDHLAGLAGQDHLYGDGGEDTLEGGDGDDVLSGGAGDDTLRGGPGVDTARFSGARKDYQVRYEPTDKQITLSSSAEGTDTLRDIETIAFSDITLAASTFETSAFVESMFTPLPRVRIKTSLGDLVVELESDRAPVTVTNFLRYADANFYDGTEFHRIISTFMAQGGGYDYVNGQYFYKNPLYPAIALEKTSATGLSNTAGTLAMARTNDANSATSQFFVNFADNRFLDAVNQPDGNGYAVFGRVADGAATLAALKQVAVVANGSGEVSQPTSAITLLDVVTEPAANTALPTGAVTISGPVRQASTLTAANTLADADGIPAAGQPGAISYYWKVDGVIVPGATSATFTPTQAYVGKSIVVAASYTDLKGTTGFVTSEPVVVGNINDRPSGRVLIQGAPTAGATLTASHTLTDLDGIPGVGQSGAISWQWRVGGVPVAGATQASYLVSATDVGKSITVSASYVDLGGTAESVQSAAAGSYAPTPASALPRAWLRTSYGDVLIELEAQKAPVTVDNFVQYLRDGFYNNTVFHRIIDGFMVQGGGYTFNSSTGQYMGKAATYPPIALEKTTTTGLSNLRGTIAMARTTDPNSASSEFFINDVDNLALNADRFLDGNGYAVFGRVIDGLPILDLLSQVPVTRNGNELSLPTSVVGIGASYYDPAPPGGDVFITGLPMQGQTLKAEHSLVDPGGFGANGVLGWIWRVDGVPVTGVTGSSYLVAESAVGRAISVQAVYRDAANNIGYVASAPTSTVLALDSVPPSVVLFSNQTTLKPGQTATVSFTLSEASPDFGLDDLTVAGGTVSNLSGSGALYTASFTPSAGGAASATVRVASGKFTDIAGNVNTDGDEADNLLTFTIDTGVQGMVYHWKTHVPLSAVDVSAAPISGSSAPISGETGADGVFELSLGSGGTYRFEASRALTSSETGSVINSADALAALKLSAGINPNTDPDGEGPLEAPPVSPYQFLAADVNGDGRVSSADALAILKMAVGRSDAPAREWLFVPETRDFWDEEALSGKGAFTTMRTSVKDASGTASGLLPADISWETGEDVNLVAVLKGDVDGSWVAPAGSQALPDSYFHALAQANPLAVQIAQFGLPVL